MRAQSAQQIAAAATAASEARYLAKIDSEQTRQFALAVVKFSGLAADWPHWFSLIKNSLASIGCGYTVMSEVPGTQQYGTGGIQIDSMNNIDHQELESLPPATC
jgi:hypothetical protein